MEWGTGGGDDGEDKCLRAVLLSIPVPPTTSRGGQECPSHNITGRGIPVPPPESDHQIGMERGQGGWGGFRCSELQVIAQLRGGKNGEVGESRGRDEGGKPSTVPRYCSLSYCSSLRLNTAIAANCGSMRLVAAQYGILRHIAAFTGAVCPCERIAQEKKLANRPQKKPQTDPQKPANRSQETRKPLPKPRDSLAANPSRSKSPAARMRERVE